MPSDSKSDPGRAQKSPVWVRRKWVSHKHEFAWAWGCSQHPRSRGFHYADMREDRWRQRMGREPRPDPWVRASMAARLHWYVYHATPKQRFELYSLKHREELDGSQGQQCDGVVRPAQGAERSDR